MIEAAGRSGCRIVAAGTHPFSSWEDQSLTPKDRYDTILREFQQLTREQIIFGCHVHAGIDDRERAIRVMNRARPWLAGRSSPSRPTRRSGSAGTPATPATGPSCSGGSR